MNLIKKFYKVLAFNATTDDHYIHQISGPTTPWPQLNDLINDSDTVLELGCGTGWLSNRIAHNWHSVDVTGIDLLEENTQYAERFAYSNSRFITQDLLECDRTADTVISVGVLHHIPGHNIKDLIKLTVNKANKYAFIGLYYKPSRTEVLRYFNAIPEHNRYSEFKRMTPWINSEIQRRSWYRDQFEHPHEKSVVLRDLDVGIPFESFGNYSGNVAMSRLLNGEFVSGFVYGVYKC